MSEISTTVEPSVSALWKNRSWRAVVAAFALNGFLFGAWAARIPAFKDRFDLDAGTLGLLLLALAGGAIVSFPFAGAASERFSADRVTVWCAWAYAPALILLALAPSSLLLGVALFGFGALHGGMDVAMNGWGAQVEQRLRRNTMSVFHAMFSLGAGLGAASGYVATRMGLSPAVHFSLVAVAGSAAALLVMMAASEKRLSAADRSPAGPLFAQPSGPLLLVGLIAFSVSLGEGAMADWSAVFLRTVSGATEAQAALGYAVFSTTMVLTRLSGSFLIERIGSVATTRLSGLIAFSGLFVTIIADGVGTALFGFAMIGVGYAVVMPLVFSRAAADPVMRPGPAIAGVATLGYGGMLLGPPIVGFIAHLMGLRVSFGVLAAFAALVCVLASTLRLPSHHSS